MKNTMFRCLLALPLVVMLMPSAQASKDRGVFIGAGFNLISVGVVDPFNNTVNFISGDVALGYKYNSYLGAEVRYGKSLQDEVLAEIDLDTGLRDTVNAKISQYYSFYYRAELANEIAKIYLLLGQSTVTTALEFESDSSYMEISDSGLSYGLGFGLWLDERMNLNFEFKTLVETDTDAFTSGSISADYRF